MPYVVPEFMETIDVEQETEFHHKDVFEHTLIVVSNVEAGRPILRKAAFFHDIGSRERSSTSTAAPTAGRRARGRAPRRVRALRRAHYPQRIHFYGHENVGAAIGRRAMQLAYPKDDVDAVATSSPTTCVHGYAASKDPWSDAAVRRFIQGHLPRAR